MGKIRNRIFHSWFRFSRPMTLGVRGLVERDDGKILLVRHTYTRGLYFPGGGVEKAETCYTALTHELEEEAGVRLTAQASLVGIYSNHRVFPNDHVLLYRVTSSDWTSCEATSRGEISEIVWADPLNPPADTTKGTARRLLEIYAGGPNDGYW
ncbi:NUDIX domain-containing protein [Henriciella litoralis]|uniref:NUDIX domain-containing protein n=1 Tax=Henriciella litoralis TaxID=568102 RepID=UPI000A03A0AC|nr:NUDIX domain-containing protein [Henriciella litoralis]